MQQQQQYLLPVRVVARRLQLVIYVQSALLAESYMGSGRSGGMRKKGV